MIQEFSRSLYLIVFVRCVFVYLVFFCIYKELAELYMLFFFRVFSGEHYNVYTENENIPQVVMDFFVFIL